MKIKRVSKNFILMNIASYAAIAFIIAAIAVALIATYHTNLKKTSDEFNDYILENVASSFNESIWSMKNFQQLLVFNDNLAELISSENTEYFSNDATWKLIDDLRGYSDYDKHIDLFFVYLRDTDSVIFKSGIVDSRLFYNTFFSGAGMSFEEWKGVVSSGVKYDNFTNISYVSEENVVTDTIMMSGIIPVGNQKNTFCVLSDKQNFIAGLEDITWETACDIYIYNQYDRLAVYETKDSEEKVPQTLEEIKKYDNHAYDVFIKKIGLMGESWSIAARIPRGKMNFKTSVLSMITVFGIFLAAVLLALLMRYLIKVNYKPIKRLEDLLGVPENRGEYDFLYDSISGVFEEKKRADDTLKNIENKFQTVIFPQMIYGNLSPQILSEYSEFFVDKKYVMAVFYLRDIETLFCDDEKMSNFERIYNLGYVLENVMKEMMSKSGIEVFFATVDTFNLCVINLDDKKSVEEINNIIESGVKFINEKFEIELESDVSKPCEGILRLSDTFEKMIKEFDTSKDNGEGYSFNVYRERGLIQSIKTGDKNAAISIVEELLSEAERTAERNYYNFIVLDIVSTIMKIFSECNYDKIDGEKISGFYKEVMSGNSIENITASLKEYVVYSCNLFSAETTKKPLRSHVHAEEMKEYIDNNFNDPNLSLEMIAARFEMSKPHLSKVFKETMGITILNYIINVRMEYANSLIKEGKLSLEKIAQMAGFGSVRSFHRIRKKYKE